MEIVRAIPELRSARSRLREPVGLVPTMGYLHAGHLSLVKQARRECASVVVSIFVNPTQFAPTEDLAAYPRDLPRDLSLLESEAVNVVWLPTPEIMYPPGYQTWVTVEGVTGVLEGKQRPTHFRGVTTVVAKLFNNVLPHKAYFGQKDAQQVVVIRRMVADLNFPVEIVVCPIVREPDGLAMSSRNVYLNPAERKAATVLHRALMAAQAAYQRGERDAENLRSIVEHMVQSEPLATLQYVAYSHRDSLEELRGAAQGGLLSLAAFVGKTRLIDNVLLESDQDT
jgi:pantoate--beta-alanine ligase